MKIVKGMKDLFGDIPLPEAGRSREYDYYDGSPPAQKHSRTSRAASSRIKGHIGPSHAAIIQFLTNNPRGATDEEMQAQIPMSANTQRPRRIELTQDDRVVDSGRSKLTRSRREAVVWILKGVLP